MFEEFFKHDIVLTSEPLQMTLDEHNAEMALFQEALSTPVLPVLDEDTLLGLPVEGYEGIYWHVKEGDTTACGIIRSGAGVSIPCTTHIPTGDTKSYRKVFKVMDGVKTPVWEIHQKDLSSSHEPYGD